MSNRARDVLVGVGGVVVVSCFTLGFAPRAAAQGFTDVTESSGVAALRADKESGWWISGFQLIDLDGDGDLDLFMGSHHDGGGIAGINDGAGHFTALAAAPWTTTELHSLYDLDEDGQVDVVVTEGDGGGRWWLNGTAGGAIAFTQTPLTDVQARTQALADLDLDGKVDWIAAGKGGGGDTSVRVYFGDGQGGFRSPTATSYALGAEGAPMPLDIDADGDIDILIQSGNYPNSPVIPEETRVYLNDGAMNFSEVTAAAGLNVPGLCVLGHGDFDGDGDVDLVGIESRKFPLVIYLNDGTGRFTKKTGAVSGPTGSAIAGNAGLAVTTDLDNDGVPDLLVAGNAFFHVLRGTGGGSFTYMNDDWGGIVSTGQLPDSAFAFGDIDGDGDLDLVGFKSVYPVKDVTVYRNDLPAQGWVNVRPVGLAGHRGAPGAQIRLYAAGTQQLLASEDVVTRSKQVQQNAYAYGETERHFGLGARGEVDVTVQFHPSNKVVRRDGVTANTTVRISEDGEGVVVPPPARPDGGLTPGAGGAAGAGGGGAGGVGGVAATPDGAPVSGGCACRAASAPGGQWPQIAGLVAAALALLDVRARRRPRASPGRKIS